MTEINGLIDEIMSLAPDVPDLDEAGRQRLDEMLSEELSDFDIDQYRLFDIEDKFHAGIELTHAEALQGLRLALDQVDAIRTVNGMFLTELHKQDKENQQLRQQQRVFVQFDVAGNA